MAVLLKVEPINGEFVLRFWVQSRTDAEHPHLVDLSEHEGFGQCSCKNWQCNVWPVIRDKAGPKYSKSTTCRHVRAALNFFLEFSLTLWIKEYGQSETPMHAPDKRGRAS